MSKKIGRISPSQLRHVYAAIYRPSSAAALADEMKIPANTFWVNFMRNGLPVRDAHKLATILERRAERMRAASERLRSLANQQENV